MMKKKKKEINSPKSIIKKIMNYKFWLLFVYFTLSLTSVFSQGYKLTAKFSNYKPQKVTLGYYYEENRYVVIDSAQQSGSTVIFEGEKPLPAGIYCVILTANNEYFDLLIDKDNQNFSMKCDVADIQKTMKITGSEVNSKFFDYQRSMTELMKQQSKIDTLKKYSTDSSEIEKYDVRLSEIDSKYSKLLLDAVEANKGNILSDMLDCMNAYTFPGNEMLNHINFSQPGLLRTPFFFPANTCSYCASYRGRSIRNNASNRLDNKESEGKSRRILLCNRLSPEFLPYILQTRYE